MQFHLQQLVSSLWANRPTAIFAFFWVILIAILCFGAPLWAPYPYDLQVLENASQSPSLAYWFGTDLLGRDLLSRILYGGRISFLIAFVASIVSFLIGVSYGMISGWVGGYVDHCMMRFVEVVYSLPYTIFVILLMVFVGRGLTPLFIAIGAVEWLTMARLVRGQILFIKGLPYIEATLVLGQNTKKIFTKHLLPNSLNIILVCLTLTIPNIMLLESFISFLGLGVQAPMTSWGDLIKEGTMAMETCPWLLIFPSFFFFTTLLALNSFGDALRSILDPR